MTNFLISYDLNATGSPHKRFLTEAINHNLLFVLSDSGSAHAYRLPNTTLWGQFSSVADARKALFEVAAAVEKMTKVKVVIEKFAVSHLGQARWNSDVKTPLKAAWTGATQFETSKLHQLNDPVFA